jgi:hypothetical protein
MLTGIDLMLKRMETHPEEFVGVNGGCSREWYAVVIPVIPYLTDDERNALNSALEKAYREHFTGQVMKQMAGEPVMTDRDRQYTEDYYGRSLPEMLRKMSETQNETLVGAMSMKNYPSLTKGSALRGAQPYQVTTAGSNGTTAPNVFGVGISGSSS